MRCTNPKWYHSKDGPPCGERVKPSATIMANCFFECNFVPRGPRNWRTNFQQNAPCNRPVQQQRSDKRSRRSSTALAAKMIAFRCMQAAHFRLPATDCEVLLLLLPLGAATKTTITQSAASTLKIFALRCSFFSFFRSSGDDSPVELWPCHLPSVRSNYVTDHVLAEQLTWKDWWVRLLN